MKTFILMLGLGLAALLHGETRFDAPIIETSLSRCIVKGRFVRRADASKEKIFQIHWETTNDRELREVLRFVKGINLSIPLGEPRGMKYSYSGGDVRMVLYFPDRKPLSIRFMGDRLSCNGVLHMIRLDDRDRLVEDTIFDWLTALPAPLKEVLEKRP